MGAPLVLPGEGAWCSVRGTFYRAVSEERLSSALQGSCTPGRYSRPGQATLYLSATHEGVAAAMIAHSQGAPPRRITLAFDVEADRILDLRHPEALAGSGLTLSDALADWQSRAAAGGTPPSWRVRDWAEAQGATGLIDPSRKAPGLWHLVLFRWNAEGGATVVPA